MGEGPEGVRVAVVTGVSRRTGIGFAIAQRLLAEGRSVLIHSWSAHDTEDAGTDDGEMTRVIEELGGLGPRLAHTEADFVDPDEPGRVIDHAIAQFGAVDVVIANHARSAAEIGSTPVRDPSPVATELPIPELAGERCSLRRWEFSDVQSLRPACGDPDICRFTTVPRAFDPASARAWIARQHAHAHAGDAIVLAIVPRHDDSPVGMVGLFGLDRKTATARLGYWVIADHRRRGFAACATQLLVGWAFTEHGLTRIHIDRELHNRASEHVADKLGAAVSGSRTVSLDGEPVELVRHTLS